MYRIKAVKVLDNYQLKIYFEDGLKGVIDLTSLIGKGIFKSWKNQKEFEKVYIDKTSHTITWPNGIDLAPEVLYEEILNRKAA